jgi:hypothetical protein
LHRVQPGKQIRAQSGSGCIQPHASGRQVGVKRIAEPGRGGEARIECGLTKRETCAQNPARSACRVVTSSVSTHMIFREQHDLADCAASLDEEGAGDRDEPYRCEYRPRARVP